MSEAITPSARLKAIRYLEGLAGREHEFGQISIRLCGGMENPLILPEWSGQRREAFAAQGRE